MTRTESLPSLDQPPAHGAAGAPGGRWHRARQVVTAVSLVALAASALVGGNLFGARERLVGSEARKPKAPAASREATAPAATTSPGSPTLLRSWPWWQDVATLQGAGPAVTESFTIADDALQWRVSGTCETGRLVVSDPSRPRPLIDAACDGAQSEYGITSKPGTKALHVRTDGPWRLDVDQQVDVPLEEPPLPSMTAPGADVVATGELYRMDQTGEGTVTVYRLADGTYALRLDDFFVTANIDLEIRLHPLEAPRTTDDYLSAPAALAAPLDITAGSLNFVLPADVDPTKYRSVVIWCPLITSAYAGATLVPAS